MDERLMKQVVVRMPLHLYEDLKTDAKHNERTMAQTVRRAIRLYLWEETGKDLYLKEEKK